jgi:hypothetical protein
VALTNDQIERYSRQIIAPGFGGTAQQKLLAARVILVADLIDAEPVLAYLVGAGVGAIDLIVDGSSAAIEPVVALMRNLNSEVTVRFLEEPADPFDLALILAASARVLDRVATLCDCPHDFATVLARLDAPAKLAVFPSRPPCPRCALDGALLAPRGDVADFVAHLAAAEALKLLAGYAESPSPTIAEFNSYAASARTFAATANPPACRCATIAPRRFR